MTSRQCLMCSTTLFGGSIVSKVRVSTTRGNNYDLVTYQTTIRCHNCEHLHRDSTSVRENYKPGYRDIDDNSASSPSRFGT